MSDGNKEVSITLVSRNQVDLKKPTDDLGKAATAADKAAASLAKVEKQAESTAAAVKKLATSADLQKAMAANPSLAALNPQLANAARQPIDVDRRINERAAAQAEKLQAEQALEEQRRKAERERQYRRISGVLNSGKGPDSATDQESDSGGPSLLDTFKSVRLKTAGLFAALGTAVLAASKALKEYSREQTASASVDASLASRGALIEQYRQKVFDLSQTLQDSTGIKRGVFESAFGQLIENGAPLDNLDQVSRVLENVAGLMRGDVSRASHALSNALEGNYQSLHSIGIILPENATALQKWAEIVRQSERGAGQLAAQNQTIAGQFQHVRNAADDLFGVLGKGIAHWSGMSYWMNIAGRGMAAAAKAMGGVRADAVPMNNVLQTTSRHLDQVRSSAAAAAQEFRSIPAASQRATDALNRQRSAAEQLLHAQDELAGAELQLRIAQINAEEHGGRISPQQADLARAAARRQSEIAQFQRHQASDTETISAAERRLNQLGTQRGLAEGEQATAQAELRRQQEAASARGAAANAQQEVQRLRQRLADEEQQNAMGATDADSPGDIARRAFATREATNRTRAEIAAAEQRAAEAQRRAQSFGPNLNDANLARAMEHVATSTERLQQVLTEIQQHTPGLQDQISSARLSRDTRGIRFGIDQHREGIELRDQLFQTPLGPNQTAVRSILREPNQTDLIHQLREALLLRSEVTTAGFRDLIGAINEDIRNIQSQIRALATRR